MRVDAPDVADSGALRAEQAVFDALEVLADDVQPAAGQERVDVGDAAGQAVLAGQHGQLGLAAVHRLDGALEGRAGQGLHAGIGVAAGEIGVGARDALEGDAAHRARTTRARSRSAGVSTPNGAWSTRAQAMRIPASSARSCSSFSRLSSGLSGRLTNRASAARR